MKESQKLKSLPQARFKFGKASIFLLIIISLVTGFILGYFLRGNNEATVTEPILEGEVITEPIFEQAMVSSVIDGDTIELEDGRVVRYLGIDTPEYEEYFFQEATNRNRELVEGKAVELQVGERDFDEYGRLLRYVYIDGIFVNAELVAQGYAKAYIFDPNDRYSQVLVQLEQYARMSGRGMWRVD
ncbi:MAG: thermonuclease family protein [Cyanobacteriota bacterium]